MSSLSKNYPKFLSHNSIGSDDKSNQEKSDYQMFTRHEYLQGGRHKQIYSVKDK